MPRPARRSKANTPKYKDSDDSDDDKDFEDSGSEASIPDDPDDDDEHFGDSDNSGEEDEDNKGPGSKRKKVTHKSRKTPGISEPKRISMDTIKRNLQSAGLRNDHSQDPLIEETIISIKSLTQQEKTLPSFLNLSESDSDSDQDSKPKKKSSAALDYMLQETALNEEFQAVASTSREQIALNKSERLSDSDSDCDNNKTAGKLDQSVDKPSTQTKLNFQNLHEETKRLEEAKQKVELYKQNVSKAKSKQDNINIEELLAIGEGDAVDDKEEDTFEYDSDSDVEDLEEVKEVKSQASIPKGGIQLVLDLPTDGVKKKKQVDMEMMIKRRINRVKKENQVFIHRVHVLCWLAHGHYVNTSLNDESVMSAALSLLPSEKSYPEGRVSLKYVEQITKWFQSIIKFKEDKHENKYRPNRQSLILTLLQQISKKTVVGKKYFVFIFIALLRALGIKCRLVLSFRVVPQRPTELLSLSLKNKNDSEKDKKKGSTKTSKFFNGEQSTSGGTTSKNPAKEKQPAKKSSASKSKKFVNISQLDGADDSIASTSSKNQRKRNMSLKKVVPEKKPKVEESPRGMSYWDQLMQNVEETPKNPTRISHRELKLKESPHFSPTQVKKENTCTDNKTIFDESTLLVPKIKRDLFSDSTLSLNEGCSSNSEPKLASFSGLSKKLTNPVSPLKEAPSSDAISSTSSIKRLSLSTKRSTRQTTKAADEAVNSNKKEEDKSESENKRPRRATKDSNEVKKSKIDTNKTPTNKPKPASRANTDPERPVGKRKTQKQAEAMSQSLSVQTPKALSSKRSLRSVHESYQNLENKDKEISSKAQSAGKKANGKQKDIENKKPSTSKSGTQEKSGVKANKSETSKYFSPVASKEVVKESNRRVSHRDLVVKSLAAGISPRGDTKESKKQQPSDANITKSVENQKKIDSRRVSEMSDADFIPSKKKASKATVVKDRRVLSSDEEDIAVTNKKKGVDVWCEVYVEEEEQWVSVDVIKAQVHCPNEIYSRCSHPVTYVVGWDNSSYLKDVTRRYVPHWNTTTRKLRADPAWYDKALRPWKTPVSSQADIREDRQLDKMQLDAPLPKSISEFKNHPLYALKRHLLKFEAIYPPDAPPLGFIRNEPVYARECVHVCRSRETWVKEAKVVKSGQEPYKIVKARPKYDRLSGNVIKDIPLEIFGPWQTEDYVAPAAENGLVPRNAYGNVELFKACMLPKGTVHLQLPSLNKVAKKLGIDCAPAMTGFDFHSGWSHPVYDGFVVCEEFKDTLIDAWEKEQEEAEARALEKIEKRVYGNWKRLIRGVLIREKLKAKYDFQDVPNSNLGGGKGKKKSKGPRFLAKKRRSCEKSSDSDSDSR